MAELDLTGLLSVSQAIDIIDATPVSPRVERISLYEALGRTVAEEVLVDRDWPSFDKSLLDGYAVRATDIAAAPAKLKVVGQIAPGESVDRAIAAGEAMAIMTGAELPAGADCIVPVEETVEGFEHAGVVTVNRAAAPGRGVAPRGSDAKAGALAVGGGMTITPAAAAVLASVGAAQVSVYAKPRAVVIATGNEIVSPDATPTPRQLRDGNSIMLASLLRNLGCDVRSAGIVHDDRDAIAAALRDGLKADVLTVTGGMSMGKFDYVPRLLNELGVEIKVSKLKIRPGKPFVFGIHRDGDHTCHVFGLPGNPLSGYVCMLRLGARLILRLYGQQPESKLQVATLAEPLPANGPRETYVPATLTSGTVTPLPWNGSADLLALAKANVLIVRPESGSAKAVGDDVGILACK